MADARIRDVIVPCEGGRHKVRLRGGLRFLASARCPKCRAPVDPTRRHRLVRRVSNLRRPASDHVLDRGLWAASLAALALSAVIAVAFWRLADQWWPMTVLLFGPRWVLLLPVVLLALLAAVRDRALLLPLLLAGWLVVGPVMGFGTGWRGWFTRSDATRDLTVVTFNARDGLSLTRSAERLIADWGADVVAFQECGGTLRAELRAMEGWSTWSVPGVCLQSRVRIADTRVMPADVIQRAGGSGIVSSHLIEGDSGPFWLTIVHLGTPRAGLERIRRGSVLEGIGLLRRDSFLREIEHRQAAAFAWEAGGPHIVVGDFNAPPESRIYRTEWDRWTNAFSRVGFGIGGTRLNGWIRARIDHVLVDDAWVVVDARMGEDVGSDHLPMIANVRRR
jgi:endonuclease/exonuclease/phosphatase (EEP) superfamily protein YafD